MISDSIYARWMDKWMVILMENPHKQANKQAGNKTKKNFIRNDR